MKKTKKEVGYTANIKILGKLFTAEGTSAVNAVENLKVGSNSKGMGILTIIHGDEQRTKVLTPQQVMRLFSQSKLTREIALKNVSMIFDL